jgi:hypothetical protein
LFAKLLCLRVPCWSWSIIGMMFIKHFPEFVSDEFTALILNTIQRFGIPGQPSILKMHSYVSCSLFVSSNNFNKIWWP